jgi:hypothetical protein
MTTRRTAVLALVVVPAFVGPALISLNAQAQSPIAGWRCAGTCVRDTAVRSEGLASASVSPAGDGVGTMNQSIKPDTFRGKRIRYSAMVKTDAIASDAGAGLWMRVDGPGVGETLQFDNMFDRPIPARTDWKRYEIVLDVPAESSYIIWGLIVNGPGKAWIDDVRIEVVGASTPSTHQAGSEKHEAHDVSAERIAATKKSRESAPLAPVNLNFERPVVAKSFF